MENEKQRQKFYNFVNTKFINLSIMIVVFIFSCGINFINSCIRKKYDDVVLSQQSLIECKNISGYLKYQHIFAALENIIVIFIGFVIYKKITVVLEEYTNSISQNKAVEPKGTVELKYLGEAVNNYIQMQNVKQNELRYKAEIDQLTPVANRRTLEDFMDKKLRQKGGRGAFLFFDVDEFKSINDSYGRDVGDEFVVWIEDTSKENTDFIKERIDYINIADMVIELTVSAGVTFC